MAKKNRLKSDSKPSSKASKTRVSKKDFGNFSDTLKNVEEHLEKQTSMFHNFKIGLLRGLGTAIGATIIAALAFAILNRVIDTVDDVPFVKDVVNKVEKAEETEN